MSAAPLVRRPSQTGSRSRSRQRSAGSGTAWSAPCKLLFNVVGRQEADERRGRQAGGDRAGGREAGVMVEPANVGCTS